jgi:hypothetical protein
LALFLVFSSIQAIWERIVSNSTLMSLTISSMASFAFSLKCFLTSEDRMGTQFKVFYFLKIIQELLI